MKTQETKQRFIEFRAQGKSFATISKKLNISAGTCVNWQKQLNDQISLIKREQLDALYESYYMTKQSRIKNLGDTLKKVDSAIEQIDFELIPPDKLLDFKLKYTQALKNEFLSTEDVKEINEQSQGLDILESFGCVLKRLQSGDVTPEQASKENAIIAQAANTYGLVEIDKKLEYLSKELSKREKN